jgi:glycosyltransferase involved in cell wall biosynthesis
MQPLDQLATVVIVPRERFSFAWESLQSILEHTPKLGSRLIYVDAGSPPPLAAQLRELAAARGFTLLRVEHVLPPNHARNLALPHIRTRYAVFCDNDIVVSPGWLTEMVACAEDTGCAVVTPLTCEGQPLHQTVHCAGGEFRIAETDGQGRPHRHVVERMHLQKRKVADVAPTLTRTPTTLAEFHCMLVRTEVFDKTGPFDPEFLSTKEHLDFCMTIGDAGYQIYFEPKAVVTYIFNKPLEQGDWRYFMLRWSDDWEVRSLRHFMAKRQLDADGYFDNRIANRGWRRHLAIWRPVAKTLSFGRRNRYLSRLLWMVDRYCINPVLVRQHRRQADSVHS